MDGEQRLAADHALKLMDQVLTPKLWPTPCAQEDGKSPEAHLAMKARMKGGPRKTVTSLTVAAKLWPTPTVPNGGRRNPEGTSITGQKPDGSKAQIDLREFAIRMDDSPSGSLNPRFVEELMGFPIDHTALRRSVTPSSPSRPTRSSRRSPRSNAGVEVELVLE
jgi:hypothetical protein